MKEIVEYIDLVIRLGQKKSFHDADIQLLHSIATNKYGEGRLSQLKANACLEHQIMNWNVAYTYLPQLWAESFVANGSKA